MKKSIIFAAALIAAMTVNAETASKKSKAPKASAYTVAETTYDNEGNVSASTIESFNVAEINVPARVRFIEGKNYGINVISLDSNTEKSIRYKVKDGVLRVYSTAEFVENGSVIINLVVPTLPELKTSASLNTMNVR